MEESFESDLRELCSNEDVVGRIARSIELYCNELLGADKSVFLEAYVTTYSLRSKMILNALRKYGEDSFSSRNVRELAEMKEYHMAEEMWKNQKKARERKEMVNKEVESLVADRVYDADHKCPNCGEKGHSEVEYEVQKRSADEGTTIGYICHNCGHRHES